MPTKVSAAMTTGVVKDTDKAAKNGLVGSEGNVPQLNSSGKIPSQLLSTGVHLGGTAAANLLDDYEEGTWTPALISGSGITFNASEAKYRKVGTLVFIHLQCTFSGTSSNRVEISGLPFAANETTACTIFHSGGSLPSGAAFLAQTHSGHNRLSGGKSSTDLSYTEVNGTNMRISGCYVAS